MMKAYCTTEGKDWDEGIPLLLFAARESIQESLGFSLFELVFGHLPRGPLILFKECWLDDDPEKSVLVHVSDVRERLRKANEFAQKNLKSAQHCMKVWYDKKARYREFNPGDKVLVLLPIHGNPLQARYSGPYTIERKVNEVDYVVNTPDHRKERRLCHINMLKPYYDKGQVKGTVATVARCVATRESDQSQQLEEVGKSPILRNSDVLLKLERKLEHLPEQEKMLIKALLVEFAVLFPDVPGKTVIVFHDVDTGNALPIKQHPYRVNPVKLMHMRNEVDYVTEWYN